MFLLCYQRNESFLRLLNVLARQGIFCWEVLVESCTYCYHDTNCIFSVYHREEKHPAGKGSALNSSFCQYKHGSKWSTTLKAPAYWTPEEKNKKSSSIFLEKQNKDSREKRSPHPIHLHNLCKYEEGQWPHYNIICCYLCIWEKCQGCVLLLLESGGKNLLGMGNREDSLPSQA